MKSGEGASAKMGTFCSVGVGPGDPGLLTLEAARLLAAAEVLAYPAAAGRDSLALSIAKAHLPVCCERLPVELEMTASEEAVAAAYDAAAASIAEHLRGGRDVLYLCLGDPLLYGSSIYLSERLSQYPRRFVPGVTSIAAAAACAHFPLARRGESLRIVSAVGDFAELRTALASSSPVAVLKAGEARHAVKSLIEAASRTKGTVYIENVGLANQSFCSDLSQLPPGQGPYFSLFLVPAKTLASPPLARSRAASS